MVSMQAQAITKVSISALVISLPIIYVSLLCVPPSTLARDSTFWFLMSNSILAILAADSGVLFFSSASHHDYYSDVVPGEEQAVAAVHEDYYRNAISVPLMACAHEPTAPVDMSAVVAGGGEHLPTSGVVSSKSKAADTAGVEEGRALALIEGEGAASKPITDMPYHASPLQRCEEEEATELEPISSNEDDATAISPAPETEETPDDDDDVPQDDVSFEVAREEVKPWCSVAEQSKPQPEEERQQYWQLSDEELNRKVEEFISRFNRDMIEQEAAAV